MGNGYVALANPFQHHSNNLSGLRSSRRFPLRPNSARILRSLRPPNSLSLRLGHYPIHPLDLAIRSVWQHVYQGECRGGQGGTKNEECRLG